MIVADAVATDLFRAVLQGLPPGTVFALVAIGFVLAYKTSGVFNFAFGAQAYASAAVYFKTHLDWGWPIVPAFLVSVVVLAPLIGFVLEWLIFRHLRTAPAVSKLVVTIGLTLALPSIIDILFDFEPKFGQLPVGIVPDGASVFYDPFGVYAFSRNELVAMGLTLVAVVGLGLLFRYSAIGLRMRSVVESPRMTALNGIYADRVSAFAWALSSFFAGLAGVLIAPRFVTLSEGEFFTVVVVAIAAAAVGRLTSIPGALAGGLGLGIFIAVVNTFLPRWSDDFTWLQPIQQNVAPAIPFLVLFGVLVFVPSLQRERESSDPLSGVDPPPSSQISVRADPRRTLVMRLVGVGALVVLFAVVFARADTVWLFLVSQGVALGIVFLSLTVITGLAGHISLAQGAFAAIGGFSAYQLSTVRDLPVLLAVVIGGLIAAAVAAALAVPIRRLGGIWVAIATLAFAFFFDAVLVRQTWVGGEAGATTSVPRPVIGPWDLNNDKSFLAFAIVVLVVAGLVVVQFGRGTIGRELVALRGSEVAARSIGISPIRFRVIAFAVSGFVAAIGGAMLAMQQENVNYATNFTPFAALFWLVLVVTFGVRRASGAIVAAAILSLFDQVVLQGTFLGWILRDPDRIPGFFPVASEWRFILFGLGTIQYARHPEGVIDHVRARNQERRERRRGPATPGASPPAAAAGGGLGATETVA